VTAVLLGAMMMHGVRTGPLIFQQNRTEVFVMYGALIVSVILFRLVAIAIIKPFSHIVRLKQSFIVPAVLILCFVGSFATGNNLWNLQAALIFGVIGFLMTATDFPVGPAVLGFILGPLLEDRFRQALIISQGNFAVFFTRPISALLLILSIVSVVYALRQRRKSSG
jgi:putative tricarboxylic transport membrane protein